MGRVELTLLRLAVFEIMYRNDVPPKVAINEALELSRQFGEGNAKSLSTVFLMPWPRLWKPAESPGPQPILQPYPSNPVKPHDARTL